MNLPREDVFCPACPDPDKAFRLEDVGMKIAHDEAFLRDGAMHVKVTRPAWEPVMLEHLRSRLDDDAHRRLYDLCVTALMAAGMTAEESAQRQVQDVADWARRSLDDALRRSL